MRFDLLTSALIGALLPLPAAAAQICNTGAITINDGLNATPYPSSIGIGGVPPGPRTISVTLNGFSHTFSDDVGIVLVGPGGEALMVQDGAGDDPDVASVSYTLADSGAAYLPDLTTWTAGTYKPTMHRIGDDFPSPGPGTAYADPGPGPANPATFASVYGAAPMNGTWNLYVRDFFTADLGSISGGWCLNVVAQQKGDLNVDGSSDLLFQQASTPGHYEAWLMNGGARIGAQLPVTPNAAATQQLRGADQFVSASAGTDDLVFWDSATGAVEFWSMNGLARVGAAIPLTGAAPLPVNWQLAATGDFNSDQQPDLLWRNTTSQNLVIWTMQGTSKDLNIVPSPNQAVNANWRVVAALDYNADGFRDLLWYNDTSGKIVLWYMDLNVTRIAGAFTNPASAGNSNWKVVAGGEYGAGPGGPPFASDIVWRNDTSGKLVLWNMDSAGNRVAGAFTTPDSPTPALDWNVVGPR